MITAALRVAFDRLPTDLTDSPMARNRRAYQWLVTRYRDVGLTSFAPDAAVRS